MVDYISVTAEVRELARSVVNTSVDFTDAEIQRWQTMRHSQLKTWTDKDIWDPLDREYGLGQLIETKLTAVDVLQHYGGPNDIAIWQAMEASAMLDLKSLVENMDSGDTTESSSIFETGYKSWNLNSDEIDPPNRLVNVGISEIDF